MGELGPVPGGFVTPNRLWMSQIARDISDPVDALLVGKRYLIHDRDPRFTAALLEMLAEVGIQSMKLPPRPPNLNAYAEDFYARSRSPAGTD